MSCAFWAIAIRPWPGTREALESSDEDRLQVRLALGRLFAEEGKTADAQQQVALGFAEARVAPVDVTSAEDYLNAADILMSIHEYPLAQQHVWSCASAGRR